MLSHDQHAVTITVESVAFFDGLGVGAHDEIAAGEGADEHDEAGLGQVKIREQGIHHTKFIRRVDENVGFTFVGDEAAVLPVDALEHTGGGGADGDDPFCLANARGGFLAERVVLGVHDVILDLLCLHGLEGADADMERDEGVRNLRQHFWREVQSSRRRGDGAFLASEDGLIALLVGFAVFALHVVRQGEMAVSRNIDGPVELQHAVAVFENLDHSTYRLANLDGVTEAEFLPRSDHASPTCRGEGIQPKNLARAVVGEKTRWHHAGVVEHEEIAIADELRKVSKHAMLDLAGGAIHDHHARGSPIRQRLAGDQLRWQMVVEVRGEHGGGGPWKRACYDARVRGRLE